VSDLDANGTIDLAKAFNDYATNGQASLDVHLSFGGTVNIQRWVMRAAERGGRLSGREPPDGALGTPLPARRIQFQPLNESYRKVLQGRVAAASRPPLASAPLGSRSGNWPRDTGATFERCDGCTYGRVAKFLDS
jgi:hypothetical protein